MGADAIPPVTRLFAQCADPIRVCVCEVARIKKYGFLPAEVSNNQKTIARPFRLYQSFVIVQFFSVASRSQQKTRSFSIILCLYSDLHTLRPSGD